MSLCQRGGWLHRTRFCRLWPSPPLSSISGYCPPVHVFHLAAFFVSNHFTQIMTPTLLIRFVTNLSIKLFSMRSSSLRSSVLRSSLFNPAMPLTQLFSYNCSLLWFFPGRANVSKPQRHLPFYSQLKFLEQSRVRSPLIVGINLYQWKRAVCDKSPV